MNESVRYIPNKTLRRLNGIAIKNGKNSLTDDCPVLRDGFNAPVFLALRGIDSGGWVRCMIPATPDCSDHVYLDVRLEDYENLPIHSTASGKLAVPATEPQADGFIIVESPTPTKPQPQPAPAPPPSRPVRHYSDEFISANGRMDWDTHAIWPIYLSGKPTGEWRGFVRSDRFDVLGKSAVLDRTFPDFDSAKAWGRDVCDRLKKAKK